MIHPLLSAFNRTQIRTEQVISLIDTSRHFDSRFPDGSLMNKNNSLHLLKTCIETLPFWSTLYYSANESAWCISRDLNGFFVNWNSKCFQVSQDGLFQAMTWAPDRLARFPCWSWTTKLTTLISKKVNTNQIWWHGSLSTGCGALSSWCWLSEGATCLFESAWEVEAQGVPLLMLNQKDLLSICDVYIVPGCRQDVNSDSLEALFGLSFAMQNSILSHRYTNTCTELLVRVRSCSIACIASKILLDGNAIVIFTSSTFTMSFETHILHYIDYRNRKESMLFARWKTNFFHASSAIPARVLGIMSS